MADEYYNNKEKKKDRLCSGFWCLSDFACLKKFQKNVFLAYKMPLTSQHPKMSWKLKAAFIVKEGKNLSALKFFPHNNQVLGSNNSILTLRFCCFNLTSPSALWRVKQREEGALVMITLYENIYQSSIHSIDQIAGHKTAWTLTFLQFSGTIFFLKLILNELFTLPSIKTPLYQCRWTSKCKADTTYKWIMKKLQKN